jgi:hypothetical protein
VDEGTTLGGLESEDDAKRATGFSPFFLVYGERLSCPQGHTTTKATRPAEKTRWTSWKKLGTWPCYTRRDISSLCDATTSRGSAPRPPSGRLGASAAARCPRAPQAYSSLGGAIHHRQDFEARNIQAGQRSRRGLQQRLEHLTTTSLLPLRCFQVVHIPRFLYIHK